MPRESSSRTHPGGLQFRRNCTIIACFESEVLHLYRFLRRYRPLYWLALQSPLESARCPRDSVASYRRPTYLTKLAPEQRRTSMGFSVQLIRAVSGLCLIVASAGVLASPSQTYCHLMLTLHFPVVGCGAAAPASHLDQQIGNGSATLLLSLPFIGSSAALTKLGKRALDEVSVGNGEVYKIVGHASRIGGVDQNDKLSRMRARSVADYLKQRGIETSRLEVEGHGFNDPLPGVSPESPAQQRVEVFRKSDHGGHR